MKFAKINQAGPNDILLSDDIIAEAYPRRKFNYSNYETDPRPNVLILGSMNHPSTGNKLTYGVNLNYLSKSQIMNLRKALPKIFSKKNLKARYHKLKDVLPDVSKYYRSYDHDYIHKVELGDVDDFMSQMPSDDDRVTPIAKQKAKKASAEKDAADSLLSTKPSHDPETQDDDIEHDREAWEIKRQLYDPDTRTQNRPEKDEYDLSANIEKDKRYKVQQKRARDLKRRAELERMAKQIQQAEADEFADNAEQELDPVDELINVESYYYSPDLGLVWDSPEAYVKFHNPRTFISERKDIGSVLKASIGESLVAAYDIVTKQLIVDLGSDHHKMLHEAHWDYSRVVLFSQDNNEVVVQHDNCTTEDVEHAVNVFRNSIVPILMAEAAP